MTTSTAHMHKGFAVMVCSALGVGALTALACMLFPGIAGGLLLRTVGILAAGILTALCWRICGFREALAGASGFDVLETMGGISRNRAAAVLFACAAVGVIVAAVGIVLLSPLTVGHDSACLLVPIGLALACTPAGLSCACWGGGWWKNQGIRVYACALVACAVGIGLLLSVKLSPLSHMIEWGLCTGVLSAGVVAGWGCAALHGVRVRSEHASKQRQAEKGRKEREARENEIARRQAEIEERHAQLAQDEAHVNALKKAVEQQLMEAAVPELSQGDLGKTALKARCREFAQEHGLSARQTEVLLLIVQGYNRKRVAEQLGISITTVNSHMRAIYSQTDIHSYQDLIEEVRGR